MLIYFIIVPIIDMFSSFESLPLSAREMDKFVKETCIGVGDKLELAKSYFRSRRPNITMAYLPGNNVDDAQDIANSKSLPPATINTEEQIYPAIPDNEGDESMAPPVPDNDGGDERMNVVSFDTNGTNRQQDEGTSQQLETPDDLPNYDPPKPIKSLKFSRHSSRAICNSLELYHEFSSLGSAHDLLDRAVKRINEVEKTKGIGCCLQIRCERSPIK